jgi:hypothetical protein
MRKSLFVIVADIIGMSRQPMIMFVIVADIIGIYTSPDNL